jgi:hypothetical protein
VYDVLELLKKLLLVARRVTIQLSS